MFFSIDLSNLFLQCVVATVVVRSHLSTRSFFFLHIDSSIALYKHNFHANKVRRGKSHTYKKNKPVDTQSIF
jgi:hypothetical protein